MTRNAYVSTSGRLAERTCPACQTVMDAVTTASLDRPRHGTPNPGDLLICAYCGALLVEQPPPFGFRSDHASPVMVIRGELYR